MIHHGVITGDQIQKHFTSADNPDALASHKYLKIMLFNMNHIN